MGPDDWDAAVAQTISLCRDADSPRLLGEVLRLDEGLELPREVVVAVYRRLLALGVADARTRLCFARYMLLMGPDWDEEANAILADVEESARAAGPWDAPHLGHHPVFFQDA